MAAVFIVVAVVGFLVLRSATTGAPVGEISGTEPAAGAKFPWEMAEQPPSSIPLDEVISGGPPPDGIPSIDAPSFVTAAEADEWLGPREPVISLVRGDTVRAYPLQIVTWHEIVNDEIDGEPITVTFCPLCNSAIAFERSVDATPDARAMLGTDDVVLDFGTSGRLYRSNLVMYDRQTKSLWVQFTGESFTGPFMGTDLVNVPVQIVGWSDVKTAHPEVEVLSRDTGQSRPYGSNPYVGYDDVDSSPFLFDGSTDDRLRPMERVVAVSEGEDSVAYRFTDLEARADDGAAVVTDRDWVVFYELGAASALDSSRIADGRDVGATGVFRPTLEGRELSFEVRDGAFVETTTGSRFDILGRGVSGPLEGEQLDAVVHDDTFWFVWATFRPGTAIWSS